MPFHDEITDFFDRYVDAFTREDADTLSELWDEVGLFPTPTGNFAMPRSAFRDHCATLFGFYRAQGVVRPEGVLLSADELFAGVAQARMAYRMMGADDAPVAEWEHVYVLRCTDTWRIADHSRWRDGGLDGQRRAALIEFATARSFSKLDG